VKCSKYIIIVILCSRNKGCFRYVIVSICIKVVVMMIMIIIIIIIMEHINSKNKPNIFIIGSKEIELLIGFVPVTTAVR